jgi:hypothetical protein
MVVGVLRVLARTFSSSLLACVDTLLELIGVCLAHFEACARGVGSLFVLGLTLASTTRASAAACGVGGEPPRITVLGVMAGCDCVGMFIGVAGSSAASNVGSGVSRLGGGDDGEARPRVLRRGLVAGATICAIACDRRVTLVVRLEASFVTVASGLAFVIAIFTRLFLSGAPYVSSNNGSGEPRVRMMPREGIRVRCKKKRLNVSDLK